MVPRIITHTGLSFANAANTFPNTIFPSFGRTLSAYPRTGRDQCPALSSSYTFFISPRSAHLERAGQGGKANVPWWSHCHSKVFVFQPFHRRSHIQMKH